MMDFASAIAALLCQVAPEGAQLDAAQTQSWLEVPPERKLGDFALPCFKLARALRQAPPKIAADLAARILEAGLPVCLARVEAVGGYLNFYLDRAALARGVLEEIRAQGPDYGREDLGHGRAVCIDYSSINIAKPFHIGHLSTTVIGNSLYRIYNFLGYKSVGINHLGDWGTQFGKLIVAYKRWGNREEIERTTINGLLDIYVRFHEEAEQCPALEDEARAWFKKIEDGDEEALSLFNWFKELTLREVAKVYELLDVHFDSYAGESFYNDKMDRVIKELADKHLLVESQGAQVVDLSAYNMPPCMILKADGATLYATRDIAAALYRKDTYDFEKCLYVVAYQQNLHFAQWFKVIELMGYPWAKDLEHVAFGMVSLEEGTLSTRKGRVVFLEDVLRAAIEKTRQIMQEKSPALENFDEVARQVGVGAIVFNTLSNNRIKDITFSYARALNFDGETGPYVQYTHARACSVLRKARYDAALPVDYALLDDEETQALLALLARYGAVVQDAMAQNEPSLITRYIVDVAQAFNRFYYEHHIMCEDPARRQARLCLTDAARTVLASGLYLIGMAAPERM
nr:arginine--tRNA ligase [Maliibacterium massiliense]